MRGWLGRGSERLLLVRLLSLGFESEDEAGAFGEFGVNGDFSVHLGCHQLADGQFKAIALGEVAHFQEGLEDILTLFLGDGAAGVADQELVLVGAALLEFQTDLPVLGRVFDGVVQKM